MRSLDAVNAVLPYFSEQPVTNLDDRNPTVGMLLTGMQQTADDLLTEGYWFNTRKAELHPDDTGRIKYPLHVLSCYADPQYVYGAPKALTQRGGYLWDVQRATWLFDTSVRVVLVERLKFEDLPTHAAQCVMYRSAAQLYLAQFGSDSIYETITRLGSHAFIQLTQEHLRNTRPTLNPNTIARWKGWLRR